MPSHHSHVVSTRNLDKKDESIEILVQCLFFLQTTWTQKIVTGPHNRINTRWDEPSAGRYHIGSILQTQGRHSAALPWEKIGCRHNTHHLPVENCQSEMSCWCRGQTMGQAVEKEECLFRQCVFSQRCLFCWQKFIKLIKGKALRKHSLHEKTAASVLLKPFISSNEWCHTTMFS